MSLLSPPPQTSRHDRDGYAAIVAGDAEAFQQHFPHMCVSGDHLGHAVALGIIHNVPFIKAELEKKEKGKASRFFVALTRGVVRELAEVALAHQRDAWLPPLFGVLGGPTIGQTVTRVLTNLAKQGRDRDVRRMLNLSLPMAEGVSRLDPFQAAIQTHQLHTLDALWQATGMSRFPHFTALLTVDALADGVTPEVRQFVLSHTNDSSLQSVLVNAAMKDQGPGLVDWWAEIQRRQLTVAQSDVDFALIQAAEQGARRSAAFLLHTLTPRPHLDVDKWRPLHEVAIGARADMVEVMAPGVTDALEACKTLMRRQKLPSNPKHTLTPDEKLAGVALIAQAVSPEQQATLVDHFGARLHVTLAHQRVEKAAAMVPATERRRRLRS